MVKKIKTEWLPVNQSKILINFAGVVKNFHNVALRGIFRIETGDWREMRGS